MEAMSLVVLFAIFFLSAERLFPGRALPHAPGCGYARGREQRFLEMLAFRDVNAGTGTGKP